MTQIITGREILAPGGVRGAPARSRIISCGDYLNAGAIQSIASTALVGQKFRLRSVDLWIEQGVEGVGPPIEVWVLSGEQVPATYAEALLFENILPLNDRNIIRPWTTIWAERYWGWKMNFEYTQVGRRFVLAINKAAGRVARVYASFGIEEG